MQALYERRQADVDAILATEPILDVFEAAALGRADRIAELVAADPNLVTAWSSDGFTALHLAAFLGTTEVAVALLDVGADVAAVCPQRHARAAAAQRGRRSQRRALPRVA